jgi:hypothetical protein
VLDPTTQELRTAFRPRDTMLLRYSFDVPPEAAEREVDLKVSVRAQVGGISIPYTLEELKLSFPNRNPMTSGSGSDIPQSGARSGDRFVEVPPDLPVGTYLLRFKATIEGLGKRACEVTIGISDGSSS